METEMEGKEDTGGMYSSKGVESGEGESKWKAEEQTEARWW